MKKSAKKKSKKPKTGRKSSRRNKVQYPALAPSYNLKTRTDEISDLQSYAKNIPTDLIDEKTGVPVLEWLNSFAEEHINANFKHKGIKIMKTDKEKRERYRSNNYRNLDIYSREKAQGKLNYIEDIKDATGKEAADDSDLEAIVDENRSWGDWDNKK